MLEFLKYIIESHYCNHSHGKRGVNFATPANARLDQGLDLSFSIEKAIQRAVKGVPEDNFAEVLFRLVAIVGGAICCKDGVALPLTSLWLSGYWAIILNCIR